MTELADDSLANLRDNAVRLQDTGPEKRRQEAAELLPLIDGELAARAAAKAELKAAALEESRARRRAAKA